MSRIINAGVMSKSWDAFIVDGKEIPAGSKKVFVVEVEHDGKVIRCEGRMPSGNTTFEQVKLG